MPTRWRFCGGGLFTEDNNGTTAIEPTKIYCKYSCESLDGTCGSAYPKGFFISTMETIIKRGKNADYTIISNGALRNSDLSWKAKGLLSYIMSLPQDWKINVKDLSKRSSDGRTATASALNELINAGYATREQVKEHGRFVGVVYTVTDCPENPKSEKPQSGFLHTENLKSENLHTENLQLQINIDTKEINNKETLNGGGFENPPTPTPDIINVDVEEITGDPINLNTETITPPSSAAPPLNDEANPNKKTLFRNSTAANRETFFKTFSGEEYATLDMEHYYNAVADWSDSSNTMRTARGWVATVRTFIRGDKEKNKLHKKQTNSIFDWDAAKAYLRM